MSPIPEGRGMFVLSTKRTAGRRRAVGIAFTAFVLMVAAVTGLLATPTVSAAQGGPDLCGYMWTDSSDPPPKVPFSWIEIQGNGTLISTSDWSNGGDDGYFGVSLGFNLTYYDGVYPVTYIGTNGYVSFGQGYTEFILPPIPDPHEPNNALYGFGEDLRPEFALSPAGVYFLALTSPNRFVIEYNQVPHYNGFNPVTFEVILFETGEVWFQYLAVSGSVQLVGIENADGGVGLTYPTGPSNNLAIEFTPPVISSGPVGVGLTPCEQRSSATPGRTADARLNVTNTGSGDDTIDMTFNSPSGWTGTFYQADGVTLLNDTDLNGYPDTGVLPAGGYIDVILRVDVPPGASGTETVSVTATSTMDASVSATAYANFAVPPASLNPPHFDYGLDTNGNGLFNLLMLEVNVSVLTPGFYIIIGDLHDATYTLFIDNGRNTFLDVGLWTVTLGYDGQRINASGIDGPYTVDLYLVDASTFQLLDNGTYTTHAYSHLQFETPQAAFNPPHSDAGVDLDGDGRFDLLNVTVNLIVTAADTYTIFSDLYDPTSPAGFSLGADASAYLTPGSATVNLSFNGALINGSGHDGPYVVDLYLYDFSLPYQFLGNNTYLTGSYLHTQFEEIPSIVSPLAPSKPSIDGAIAQGEWTSAAVVDLSTISGNSLPGLLYVENDYTRLYVAYDAIGDTTRDTNDTASIGFDTGNDATYSDGHEDQFAQGGFASNNQAHLVYNATVDGWVVQDSPYDPSLPNHAGLASAWGYGPSPNSGTSHRMYEFSIPLALLGALPGDTLGFWGGSVVVPGLIDASTYANSAWPSSYTGFLPAFAYGDLRLAPDSTPPTVSITSPPSGALLAVSTVNVTWSASDAGLGLGALRVSVDGGAEIVLPSTATWYVFTGLADGAHTISVTAYDRAGNSATDSISVTTDASPPDLAITAPASGAKIPSGTVQMTWTASDAVSGLDHFEISLDGGPSMIRAATVRDITFSGLSDASHTVTVTGFDQVGHSRIVSTTFVVDTVAPTVAISSPAGGASVPTSSVTVTWTASDAGSGIDHITISVDGGAATTLSASATSQTLTGLADGAHTVTVTVVDRAGNSETATRTFHVDTSLFSPAGPYGSTVLISLVLVLVVAAAAAILFLRRRRGGRPPQRESRPGGEPGSGENEPPPP